MGARGCKVSECSLSIGDAGDDVGTDFDEPSALNACAPMGYFGRRCALCNATQEDSIAIVRSEAKASCAMFVYVEAPDIDDLLECVKVRVRQKKDSCHVLLPE